MNTIEIGKYIKAKRILGGLTQKDLAEKLNISFQAVSKWETGSTLPDTALLLSLSDIFETSIDSILLAGRPRVKTGKTVDISKIKQGIDCLSNMKEYFGEKSAIYQGITNGINAVMNLDFETAISDEYHQEVLLAEAVIHYIVEGFTFNIEDIDEFFKSQKMKTIILRYKDRYS